MSFHFMWAVHIADGILGWPWLMAGFALIGVLAVVAAWRVREEEIPRIALLTAAFFVASSIHVKLGFSSAHLLLNGLVGVILGWRAPLAILLGVTMQAFLLAHGGVSTIGVNACSEALPALLAGALFPCLYALTHRGHAWTRSVLVVVSAGLLGVFLVVAVALLSNNPIRGMFQWNDRAGLVVALDQFASTRDLLIHPITLSGVAVLALLAVVVERRQHAMPEFVLGCCLGALSVIATAVLTGVILLAGGADGWNRIVSVFLVAHFPIALVEGVILGCTLGFLARVKPEMLGLKVPVPAKEVRTEPVDSIQQTLDGPTLPLPSRKTGVMLVLVLGTLLFSPASVQGHRLQAEHKVDRANRRVTVESWYETDDVPQDARARVLRSDGSILAEGALDANGTFVFAFEKAEPLTVQVDAPGGHRATCKITATELEGAATTVSPTASTDRNGSVAPREEGRFYELAAGVALVLAGAAFVVSWSNSRRLRRLESRDKGE
jgi:cobalt/nickel transport system permease protein